MQKMTDVLLIQPPVAFKKEILKNDIIPNCPHLGLLYLAAGIEKLGFSVEILDTMDISSGIKDALAYIKDRRVKIIGITAMTMNVRGAVELAKPIKNDSQINAVVCLGGPHLSADLTFIERFPFFDVGIRGEADITFPRVVADIIGKKREYKGLIEAESPLNFDELLILTREDVDYDKYIN